MRATVIFTMLTAAGALATAACPAAAQQATAPETTFAQVLAAPDDVAINLSYAKAQIAQGHLLYAAAAYERLLLASPDDDEVRLLYVAVLLDLDDPVSARRELAKLQPITLTPEQQARWAQLSARLPATAAPVSAPAQAGAAQ